jgi:hypothetical protein
MGIGRAGVSTIDKVHQVDSLKFSSEILILIASPLTYVIENNYRVDQ